MTNPVLVEVVRGAAVESRHRGAVAVCDTEGADYLAIGDVATPIFPRSAVKPFQALPLVESRRRRRLRPRRQGAGDRLRLARRRAEHVAAVEEFLARAGLDGRALECGAHWPLHQASARALARDQKAPSALHNNCSGKHAGMLCLATQDGRRSPPLHRLRASGAAGGQRRRLRACSISSLIPTASTAARSRLMRFPCATSRARSRASAPAAISARSATRPRAA